MKNAMCANDSRPDGTVSPREKGAWPPGAVHGGGGRAPAEIPHRPGLRSCALAPGAGRTRRGAAGAIPGVPVQPAGADRAGGSPALVRGQPVCPLGGGLGEAGWAAVPAADVTRFVVAECSARSRPSACKLLSCLRSFLRFIYLDGHTAVALWRAVPPAATWSASSLPRWVAAEQVAALLASCDRHSAAGRRDFAILVLLSRLGLRAGEVAAMQLSDIDWRAGEMVVHGKGRRDEKLPLPHDAGEALADYLQHGRPRTADRSVFVRLRAPRRGLTPQGVSSVVCLASERAGLGPVGAHRLRHTAATGMLRAGASLAEVGQVLRQRSSGVTAIYAKVDHKSLRTLARPWPGGAA